MADLLYILVEGTDDRRFFETLGHRLDLQFQVWEYANETRSRRENFIRSLSRMPADYLYVTDLDRLPCPSARRERACEMTRGLDHRKVIVVVPEIEGWYLAGLSTQSAQDLGVTVPQTTDGVTKEDFDRQIPARFDSRTDFMVDVLKRFEPPIARARSRSFVYLLDRLERLSSQEIKTFGSL